MELSERIQEANLERGIGYRWIVGGLFLLANCGLITAEQEVERKSDETAYVEWIRQLDSSSWQRREQAWRNLCLELERIEEEQSESSELLVVVRLALTDPGISFEVQERLLFLEREIAEASKENGKETNFKIQKGTNEILDEGIGREFIGKSDGNFNGKNGLKTTLEAESKALSTRPCWKMLFSDAPVERKLGEREVRGLLEDGDDPYLAMCILRDLLVKENMSEDDRERMWRLERQARLRWIKEAANLPKRNSENSEEEIRENVEFLASANLPEDRLVPWMEFEERCRVEFTAAPCEELFGGDGFSFLNCGKDENGEIYGLKVWKTVQHLEEALMRNGSSETAFQVIGEKLNSREMTPAGTILLKRLEFLTKPCLAAEYWRDGEMKSVQLLRIGIPQDCGVGISYFDVLGKETVHCQGGSNLAPGDYPLDAAVPHPNQPDAFFCLTALRTPAEKLLYPTIMAKESQIRWKEVSRKTLDWLEKELFEKKRALSFQEIQLLGYLEMEETSARIGEWFATEEKREQIVDESSRLMKKSAEKQTSCAYLCELLFRKGTKEAIPGLLEIADKEIFWIQSRSRERIAYWAILGISLNEEWEGMEDWLVSQLENDCELQEILVEEDESPMVRTMSRQSGTKREESEKGGNSKMGRATVGATAAAILLKKQGRSLEGIREITLQACERQGGVFYGFESEVDAKRICGKLRKDFGRSKRN